MKPINGQTALTAVISSSEEPRDPMQALSQDARFILDRMEGDRRYDMTDLRAVAPDASSEGLREVMHELWIKREVERVGDSAWRRHRSAPVDDTARDTQPEDVKIVKPEDLFDHDTFQDFFR